MLEVEEVMLFVNALYWGWAITSCSVLTKIPFHEVRLCLFIQVVLWLLCLQIQLQHVLVHEVGGINGNFDL